MKKYISRHKKIDKLIKTSPNKGLFNIIVVPVLNEPKIIKYLQSISDCDKPNKNVEVILIINSSEVVNDDVVEQNRKTYKQLLEFAKQNNTEKLSFYPFIFENLPKKQAGAGLARKYGMDEALERFYDAQIDGVITSLDADTFVEKNYLIEIERVFSVDNIKGATIYYEHPIDGNEENDEVYKSIISYELYLRYYYQVLKYIGVPYAYHTIGSAFVVRASTYAKQGGMKPNQAGEDFYFLQKIIPVKGFVEINSTAVYPSSRISYRVIFGTGPAIGEISNSKNQQYYVYSLQSFIDLKQFFDNWQAFFNINNNDYNKLVNNFSKPINDFLDDINFYQEIVKISKNTSNLTTFRKAFFTKFDAFKVIRFLNTSHNNYYKKEEISIVATEMLQLLNYDTDNLTSKKLLQFYRNLEK